MDMHRIESAVRRAEKAAHHARAMLNDEAATAKARKRNARKAGAAVRRLKEAYRTADLLADLP